MSGNGDSERSQISELKRKRGQLGESLPSQLLGQMSSLLPKNKDTLEQTACGDCGLSVCELSVCLSVKGAGETTTCLESFNIVYLKADDLKSSSAQDSILIFF